MECYRVAYAWCSSAFMGDDRVRDYISTLWHMAQSRF